MHPHFADGWFELGLAQQELGELAAAAAALKAGLRLQPAADGRLSAYAALLQSMGRTDEARSAYRRAIARSPADSDAHFNLGTVEELVGEHAAALASYRTALELDPPDEARVHNNIGGVLSAMGDLRASAAAYAEAVEADPGLADAWYNLGNVMFAQGSHAQAETHLQRALRLAPAHSKAGRKLEHVRADGSVGAQRLYELGQQMQLVEDAAAACTARAEEVTCVQEYSEAVRAEREANGPLFV